jgi:hypothetical protein
MSEQKRRNAIKEGYETLAMLLSPGDVSPKLAELASPEKKAQAAVMASEVCAPNFFLYEIEFWVSHTTFGSSLGTPVDRGEPVGRERTGKLKRWERERVVCSSAPSSSASGCNKTSMSFVLKSNASSEHALIIPALMCLLVPSPSDFFLVWLWADQL